MADNWFKPVKNALSTLQVLLMFSLISNESVLLFRGHETACVSCCVDLRLYECMLL